MAVIAAPPERVAPTAAPALVLRPQAGPQERYLASSADIAIYGGAAGGGKSWALLLEPLRHVANPRFGATFFRQNTTQIRAQGGLWDESATLYGPLGATPREQLLDWTFPSGAHIKFAHMQYESTKYEYQGAQIPLINWDELTHFSETQFFYMLTRNRSMCGVRPYVRATCNPDADSWVASFIAWWIDQETGYPIPERSGVIRYMTRLNGTILWGDTRAEVAAQCPPADDGTPFDEGNVKSVTFIPASLDDNQALLAKDPGYRANLMAQPLVERERLLGGNWKIRHTAGKIFNRAWFDIVPAAPAGGVECRYWDLAATEKKTKGDDPDYTAGVKIRRVAGVYYVMDAIAVREGPAAVDTLLVNMAAQDAHTALTTGTTYRTRWEQEGGASGKRDSLRIAQLLAGYDARGVRPQGDKIARATGLAAQAFAGNVKLVAGAWNDAWLAHMHGQPDLPHDDTMDGSSGAFNDLCALESPFRGADVDAALSIDVTPDTDLFA